MRAHHCIHHASKGAIKKESTKGRNNQRSIMVKHNPRKLVQSLEALGSLLEKGHLGAFRWVIALLTPV